MAQLDLLQGSPPDVSEVVDQLSGLRLDDDGIVLQSKSSAWLALILTLSSLIFSSANRPASMRLASSTSCSALSSATLPICFR